MFLAASKSTQFAIHKNACQAVIQTVEKYYTIT